MSTTTKKENKEALKLQQKEQHINGEKTEEKKEKNGKSKKIKNMLKDFKLFY